MKLALTVTLVLFFSNLCLGAHGPVQDPEPAACSDQAVEGCAGQSIGAACEYRIYTEVVQGTCVSDPQIAGGCCCAEK
jgi:hypothetical protein